MEHICRICKNWRRTFSDRSSGHWGQCVYYGGPTREDDNCPSWEPIGGWPDKPVFTAPKHALLISCVFGFAVVALLTILLVILVKGCAQ